uniref:uncharacterized protein n=1 Tax=Myxine glutinosa TaxID=7769 RepID=UPI00358EE732
MLSPLSFCTSSVFLHIFHSLTIPIAPSMCSIIPENNSRPTRIPPGIPTENAIHFSQALQHSKAVIRNSLGIVNTEKEQKLPRKMGTHPPERQTPGLRTSQDFSQFSAVPTTEQWRVVTEELGSHNNHLWSTAVAIAACLLLGGGAFALGLILGQRARRQYRPNSFPADRYVDGDGPKVGIKDNKSNGTKEVPPVNDPSRDVPGFTELPEEPRIDVPVTSLPNDQAFLADLRGRLSSRKGTDGNQLENDEERRAESGTQHEAVTAGSPGVVLVSGTRGQKNEEERRVARCLAQAAMAVKVAQRDDVETTKQKETEDGHVNKEKKEENKEE